MKYLIFFPAILVLGTLVGVGQAWVITEIWQSADLTALFDRTPTTVQAYGFAVIFGWLISGITIAISQLRENSDTKGALFVSFGISVFYFLALLLAWGVVGVIN